MVVNSALHSHFCNDPLNRRPLGLSRYRHCIVCTISATEIIWDCSNSLSIGCKAGFTSRVEGLCLDFWRGNLILAETMETGLWLRSRGKKLKTITGVGFCRSSSSSWLFSGIPTNTFNRIADVLMLEPSYFDLHSNVEYLGFQNVTIPPTNPQMLGWFMPWKIELDNSRNFPPNSMLTTTPWLQKI